MTERHLSSLANNTIMNILTSKDLLYLIELEEKGTFLHDQLDHKDGERLEFVRNLKQTLLRQPENIQMDYIRDCLVLATDLLDRSNRQKIAECRSEHIDALSMMVESVHFTYLSGSSAPEPFNNIICCALLRALPVVCPKCEGGSTAHKEILAHFYKSSQILGWDAEDSYVKDIAKKSKWFNKLKEKYQNMDLTY